MAREVYQITTKDIQSLLDELNIALFEISKRLGELDISTPVDLSSATTVSDIVDALVSAGIGTTDG